MKKFNLIYYIITILIAITACEKEEETVSVTGVTLNNSQLTIQVEDTAGLIATISPEDATDKSVSWISSDDNIALVNATGLVTAMSIGQAVITVKTTDGSFEAQCNITVTPEPILVTAISLNIEKDTLDIDCELQLIATITPDDATDKSVSWASSDNSIATVSENGLVTAIAGGSATITATTTDGGFSASCIILVKGIGTISEIMVKGFLETAGYKAGIDIVTDNNGNPFIALNKKDAALVADTKASAEVWKYDGSLWAQFGGSRIEITDDEAYSPGITIAADGTVYVAYEYYDDSDDVRYGNRVIAFSTGAGWETLGGNSNNSLIMDGSNPLDGASELALKEDGTLLISMVSYGDGYVHYYNTGETKWKSYNGYKTDSENFWAGGIDIATFGNKPYVSVRTGSGDGKTGVLSGNEINGQNEQWEWLDGTYANSQNASFQDVQVGEASLAIDNNGTIYTSYQSAEDIYVKRFSQDGSSWENIPFSKTFSMSPNEVNVVVSNNTLFLVIANYNGGIEIHRLNECGKWIYEGTTSNIDYYYNIELTSGINGEFYISYEATDSDNGKVGVFKYNPFTFSK